MNKNNLIAVALFFFVFLGSLFAGKYVETSVAAPVSEPVVSAICGYCSNKICVPCTGDKVSVGECTLDSQCAGVTGLVCGNGKCEGGETYTNCPNDCFQPGAICGNNDCEAKESSLTCPKDCGTGGAGGTGGKDGTCTANGGEGQCAVGYSCSCPEGTYDWERGIAPLDDCKCGLVPPDQEPCGHTICPVGYKCNKELEPGEDPGDWYCEPKVVKTPMGGPLPTATPAPITQASCNMTKTYSTQWTEITPQAFSGLRAGVSVYFCVNGLTNSNTPFDMGRFTINGVLRNQTTLKRPGTNDFCELYTIPTNTYTFKVQGEIHHSALGWL